MMSASAINQWWKDSRKALRTLSSKAKATGEIAAVYIAAVYNRCEEMRYQDEISQLLIHELVHAYDDCVVKNMDWKNCAHHACSEIRANHLSGDCHYKRELLRGFMKMRGHEQECVKRRALMSLRNNPHCSETAAKDAVEAVWSICYNDTRPFDRAP